MKFLLTIATMAILNAGIIPTFEHPNDLVSFPAPVIPVVIVLDLGELQSEFPQNRVSFDGGLVGYFPPLPFLGVAPIWTTPAVAWIPTEEPEAQFIAPPPTQPTTPVQPSEVPEPSTLALLALGLFCIAAGWHKKI